MPSDRSLFDRLRRPDSAATRSASQSTNQIHDSVLAHLQRMMNARHGESPAAPEYGMPEYGLLAIGAEFVTAQEQMCRGIERSIRRYEPRLGGVRVRPLEKDPDDPLTIQFEINGRLVTAEKKDRVRFTSVVDSRGEWQVD